MRTDAVGIQIFIAQHQDAATFLGALLRNPKCARMAKVQMAGGRWREPPAVASMKTAGT